MTARQLVFTTVRGAPGCTIASLVVAAVLAESASVVWVEADPAGGVMAGVSPVLAPRLRTTV